MNCNLNKNTFFVPVHVWVSLTIFTSTDAFVYNRQASCLHKNQNLFFRKNSIFFASQVFGLIFTP